MPANVNVHVRVQTQAQAHVEAFGAIACLHAAEEPLDSQRQKQPPMVPHLAAGGIAALVEDLRQNIIGLDRVGKGWIGLDDCISPRWQC